MSRSLVLGLVLVIVSFSGPAHGNGTTVETEGVFTKYSGDVAPDGSPSINTHINGVPVPPTVPTDIKNGVVQGELALPAGTTSVEFKVADGFGGFNLPSVLSWTPAVSAVPSTPDGSFLFGIFGITNGIFFFEATFEMTFTTASSDPAFDGKTFSDILHYVVTPNNGVSAFDDADYIFLANHPGLNPPSVRINEGSSGTVELWGKVGSLDPLFFANPTGGVQLFQTTPIPEPEVLALMLVGLLGVGAAARRERRRRAA
jgi:hypothetical protein